jgi:hypothetical protein
MSKKVTNTRTQDPMITMLEMMAGGGPRAIEAQEARGPRELVAAEVLPTEGTTRPTERTTWESMGIVISDPVKGDDLFTNVALPTGWKKQRTSHSMWSNLVDDKGRKRASIFYKAAFYDRDAFIRPVARFSIERDYDRDDVIVMCVKDCDNIVYRTDPCAFDKGDWKSREALEDAAHAKCRAWLVDRGYPDFTNVVMYWDASP